MILTHIGYGLSGLLGLGIIFIGTRFLLAPRAAAAGFGIAVGQSGESTDPYLSVKGVRDIASGFVALILLATGVPHILGGFMLAASIIPIGDAIIVLRRKGSKSHRLRRARSDRSSDAGHRRVPIYPTDLSGGRPRALVQRPARSPVNRAHSERGMGCRMRHYLVSSRRRRTGSGFPALPSGCGRTAGRFTRATA